MEKNSQNGLRKAFVWMISLFGVIVCLTTGTTSCKEEDDYENSRSVVQFRDTFIQPAKKGYEYATELTHRLDTARKTTVWDYMTSHLTVWRTADDQRVEKLLDNYADPQVEAHSVLAREDYTIRPDQLDIRPSSERVERQPDDAKDSTAVVRYERGTVYYEFKDGQVFSIPFEITNKTVVVANYLYYYAGVTFDHAEFVHLRNDLAVTRAAGDLVKTPYNTEYKANLYFREVNVTSPKLIKLPIYAYTKRTIVDDDKIVSLRLENDKLVLLDSVKSEASVDVVTTWESGDETREHFSHILYHHCKGIDPYIKFVDNFDYIPTRCYGLQWENESENRVENLWKVWRRYGKYATDIENGVAADKITTDYSAMEERAEFRYNDTLVAKFSYQGWTLSEKKTTITPRTSDKDHYDKALLDNHINATYMGLTQDVSEFVWLYKKAKEVVSYEFENPNLVVYRDSVVGDIDFIRHFNDGTKDKIHDHINVPRRLDVLTDWESIQRKATHVTDTEIKVNMENTENCSEGYWRFERQTRKLTAYATLYDGTSKLNAWQSVVPNFFVYTREGQTYKFRELLYAVEQNGGSLNLRGKENGYTLYDYKDNMTEHFDTDNKKSAAPGLIKVPEKEITGFDIRDKQLIVYPDSVVAKLNFVTLFSDETETSEPVSKRFDRKLVPTTDWLSYEANASETTSQPEVTSFQKRDMQERNEWYWDEELRTISATVKLAGSTQYNGWTSTDPNNIRFTREGLVAEFGTLDFGVAKINSNVTLKASEPLQDTYAYTNTIQVTYGAKAYNSGMSTSTAPGTIIVKKGKEVVSHEFRNPQLVITDDNVTASLTYVTLWNDGTETTEFVQKVFGRGLSPYTNWETTETSPSTVTGIANILLQKQNKVVDGNWSYENEQRDITTITKLVGSTQKNGWTSIDPNSIKYTRDGETYDFGKIDFTATEVGDDVKLVSSTSTKDTYSFFDNLRVTFGTNTKASKAPGTIYIIKEEPKNDPTITGYEIRNPQLVVSNDYVTASLTFVTIWSDYHETSENVNHQFARSLNPYTNWTSNETNGNEQTSSATSQVISSQNKSEGEWSYVSETYRINTTAKLAGSSQTNGWNAIEPNSIVFSRNGKTYAFDKISFAATESGHKSTLSSSSAMLDTYSYTDQITVVYGGNTKYSTAPGTINVQKSKEVTDYEIRSPKLVVNTDNVTATLIFVTKYNDGSEDKENVSNTFPRSLNPYTNWSANEKNANETTSAATFNLKSSSNKTDGYWSYVSETYRINTTATLASSKQTNGWDAVEPNSIVFSRNGKTYAFDKISFAATESGHGTTLASSSALTDVYNYVDQITVTYGGNSKSSKAPGSITVQKDKEVTDYEIRSPKLVVNTNDVTASLIFVTKYNDGSEDTENLSHSFPRSLNPYTNWSANESNANETTGAASVSMKASTNQSEGEWSYVKEERRINTTAKLSGSTQTNGWDAVDPNSIVFSRNGKTHTFDKLTFAATEAGHGTTLTNSTNLADTYNYVDNITVTYGGNSKSSKAPGTITVKKEKQVTEHEFRNPKLVVNDNNVTASLTYVTKYNDGSEDTENVSKQFPRSLNPYTNWASTEQNNKETTGSANVTLKSSTNQSDGNWSYVKETRDITTIAKLAATQQTNGWTAEDPNSIKYTRDGQTYSFSVLNFTATEAGHNVSLKNENSTLATYNYTDKINVTFGDNTKSSTAPGTINVEKEIVITGYEISNQKLVVEQNSVTASLTFTTLYSDGTSKTENLSKVLPRTFAVKTNWSSNEKNNSQTTSATTVTLTSSQNKTDGDWSYVNETRNINTTAKLAGSNQTNGWESVDPNSITFSKNGKTYNFGALVYNATETGAKVNQKSSNDDETVYSYTDNISVSYGTNSFNSSAPGTITVAKPWTPDFPEEYGKFTSVAVTASQNEGHNTWLYVVSIHFVNGTYAMIIRQNASSPDAINSSMYTTLTDSRLNSAFYIKNQSRWIHAIASDESNRMMWKDTNGNAAGMLVHSTATEWGWDDGYRRDGHPSVFTNKYSAKLSNNNTVLTIYKGGNVFATYKSAK